jgi:hypothetical protein
MTAMAARLGNALYWLGCIVAVGWVAVSHAAEKADDDAFLLACVWTGDHKATSCGGFPTRALCEREGRIAVANGELSKFRCISTAELAALLEAIGHIFADQPTAAGPGGSDQPTFSKQMPVRPAAPDPLAQYHQQMDDPGFRWMRKFAGPSRPYDPNAQGPYMPKELQGGGVFRGAPPPLPPPTTTMIPQQAAGGPPGWAPATEGRGIGVPSAPTQPFSNWPRFMKNARPSANIEDYRRTRGKPFIAQ